MAPLVLVRGRGLHQVDELVAELDEGITRAFAAEREVKNLAVEIERLIDIADFERDMVDADKPGLAGFAGFGHPRPPSCWCHAHRLYMLMSARFSRACKRRFRVRQRASRSQGR